VQIQHAINRHLDGFVHLYRATYLLCSCFFNPNPE
jgi:hypothetical protein